MGSYLLTETMTRRHHLSMSSYDRLFPQQIRGILSQRLFIEESGLPSSLTNQIKWLAAFQNPEFYRKQSLRLSTHQEARIIS
jgi:hypothetical protein